MRSLTAALRRKIQSSSSAFQDFPRPFWVLMGATLIDQTGRFLLVPFFGLYITSKFGIDMIQLGQLYFIWAIFGIVGSFISGALTDKIGRRVMVITGLVFSAGISLFLGFTDDVRVVFGLAALVGLLSDIGGPAQSAMVADLLPAERRTDGFGIWRVVVNIAAVIGPLAGGLLVGSGEHYLRLFIADAVLSALTAVVVFKTISETRPKSHADRPQESFVKAVLGYGRVLSDAAYMAFIVISILPLMVYAQMNTTMPVYMRDIGHIPPQEGYSYLLALNAFLVVTLQIWVTRRISKYAPLPILALGVVLYSIGFGMFGFSTYLPFLFLAMAIITFGELIGAPTAQAVAARFAPEDMRGRYLAMFNFSWALPFALGPYLAGWVWVQISPQWMWYAAGLLGLVGALAYLGLHRWAGRRITTTSQENESAAGVSEISAS